MTARRFEPIPPNKRDNMAATAVSMALRPMLVINNNEPSARATKTNEAPIGPINDDRVWPTAAPTHPPAPPSASTPVYASGPRRMCSCPRAATTMAPQPRANFIRLGAWSPRSNATPTAMDTSGNPYRARPMMAPSAVSVPRPTGPARRT